MKKKKLSGQQNEEILKEEYGDGEVERTKKVPSRGAVNRSRN